MKKLKKNPTLAEATGRPIRIRSVKIKSLNNDGKRCLNTWLNAYQPVRANEFRQLLTDPDYQQFYAFMSETFGDDISLIARIDDIPGLEMDLMKHSGLTVDVVETLVFGNHD